MAYTTRAQIEQYLQRTLNTSEVGMLIIVLPSVKKWIDKTLGSTFDEAAESSRYYVGGTKYLSIDPCTAISEVMAVNDDLSDSYEYTVNTEYIAEPINETVKNEIIKVNGTFPSGSKRIKVTAKFSEYSNGVPEDIQMAATILASEVLNQGRNASVGGNIKSESLEGHRVEYDTSDNTMEALSRDNPHVKGILDLRRELLAG